MGIQIVITPGAAELLSKKCIGENDALTAVQIAEQNNRYFEDENGVRLCALQLENVTYWVSYMLHGNVLEVTGAYCHRMKFEETV